MNRVESLKRAGFLIVLSNDPRVRGVGLVGVRKGAVAWGRLDMCVWGGGGHQAIWDPRRWIEEADRKSLEVCGGEFVKTLSTYNVGGPPFGWVGQGHVSHPMVSPTLCKGIGLLYSTYTLYLGADRGDGGWIPLFGPPCRVFNTGPKARPHCPPLCV